MPTFPTGRVTHAWAPFHAKSPAYMQELAEITAEQKRMEREFLLIKRRIAWNRVIDEAIKVARLLGELEVQEALKSWRDQPRVRAGNPDGGQWTDEGGGGGAAASSDEGRVISDANPDNDWKPGAQYAQAKKPPGIGHNNPPPDEPPEIPEKEPASLGEKISLAKAVANYMAATSSLIVLEGWALSKIWPMVRSSFAPPRSLSDFQRSHLPSEAGYHDHHIAEQAAARAAGFSPSKIDGPDNVVRIPQFKHYEITQWYATENKAFGGKSPREYLVGKSWQERQLIGREILIEKEILKPEAEISGWRKHR